MKKKITSATQTYRKDMAVSKSNHTVLKIKLQQHSLSHLFFPQVYHVTLLWIKGQSTRFFIRAVHIQ